MRQGRKPFYTVDVKIKVKFIFFHIIQLSDNILVY